jgi:hypothetical protein
MFDAALLWPNNKYYFFQGTYWASWDVATAKLDPGFPRPISEGFPDLASWLGDAPLVDAVVLPAGTALSRDVPVAFFFKSGEVLTYKATGRYGEMIGTAMVTANIVNTEIVELAARNQPANLTKDANLYAECKNDHDAFLMYDGPGSSYIGGAGPGNPGSNFSGGVSPLYLCSQLTIDKCADQLTRRACPETCMRLGYSGAVCDAQIFVPPTYFGTPDLDRCASVVAVQGASRACANPFWNRFCPNACATKTYLKSWCDVSRSPTEICMSKMAASFDQCKAKWNAQISVLGDQSGTGLVFGPFQSQANCEEAFNAMASDRTTSPCVASFLTLRNWGFNSCPSFYEEILAERGPYRSSVFGFPSPTWLDRRR